ncbi:MAG: ribonuclease HI family protein [Aigarchaeota archaeon]|nr:ribonuclease HI family protein [Candidatus Caldarchaeales archaeon]MDJ0272366.1 ribonuclease HI family protein [Candidatus Caldarchaeales archaeon]
MPSPLSHEAEIYVDGASRGNPGPAGIGYIIKIGEQSFKHRQHIGVATNNQAEYHALIKSLEKALQLGVKKAHVYSDSELLVNQVNGIYKIRNTQLSALHQKLQQLITRFEEFTITHVEREKNWEADRLANQAIDEAMP